MGQQQHKTSIICLVLISLWYFMGTKMLKLAEIRMLHPRPIVQEPKERIYFFETRDDKANFSGREACAFESAAIHNPDKQVLVVLSTNSQMVGLPEHFRMMKNVQFIRMDFDVLINGTPVEDLWKSNKVHESGYAIVDKSDLLRLCLLFKSGGIYLDTDIISLKPLPNLPNFAIREDATYINNAVLKFERGHAFLLDSLQSAAKRYTENSWGVVGPSLITSVALESYCQSDKSPFGECNHNLTIMPPSAAFAIDCSKWEIYYSPQGMQDVERMLSDSILTHYWNHMRIFAQRSIVIDAQQPFYKLAEINCPLTVKHVLRHKIGKTY